jgi:hypothetical protein
MQSLQELTGQESGLIKYQEELILFNWSSFERIARMLFGFNPRILAGLSLSLETSIPECLRQKTWEGGYLDER